MDASGPSAAQYRWSEGKPPSAPTTHIERTCIRGIQSWQWCSAEVGSTGLLGSPAHSSLSVCTVCCPTTKRTTTKRKPAQSLAKFLHLLKYLMSRISFSSPFSKRAEGETSSFRPCLPKFHGAGAVKWRRPRTLLVWEYLGILVKNSKNLVYFPGPTQQGKEKRTGDRGRARKSWVRPRDR